MGVVPGTGKAPQGGCCFSSRCGSEGHSSTWGGHARQALLGCVLTGEEKGAASKGQNSSLVKWLVEQS